jgi:hypothetical protein
VWCARPGSPLSIAASKHQFVDLYDFSLPSGKDGFLALNSLLAFGVLLARAYSVALGPDPDLPPTFDALLGEGEWRDPNALDRLCASLWKRQTLVVLHGPSTLSAAIDIESKFTEAALGAVQLADFRHFAHGRHHWIAKRRSESAILAITTDEDRKAAELVIDLLPAEVPLLRVDVPHSGYRAAMSAMARLFFVAASAGRARGIDPGDPGVPPFGRRIYHLNVYEKLPAETRLPVEERVAIERKAGERVTDLMRAGRLTFWRDAYRTAWERLKATAFRGLVVDYDGTLCNEAERFGPLPRVIAAELVRLLRGGAIIGIATGRGRSVRKSLQDALPEKLWRRVVIGYYNGAELGMLADDSCPDNRQEAGPELQPVEKLLKSDKSLSPLAHFTVRLRQITLTPAEGAFPGPLWEHVHSLLETHPELGAVALRSGHSVDVVAKATTKLAVVERVREMAGAESGAVLRIGDRGCSPGNDFALLASSHAVSSDEVSPQPETAWNLAPPGHRGCQATLGYLSHLFCRRGTLRFLKRSVGRNKR